MSIDELCLIILAALCAVRIIILMIKLYRMSDEAYFIRIELRGKDYFIGVLQKDIDSLREEVDKLKQKSNDETIPDQEKK